MTGVLVVGQSCSAANYSRLSNLESMAAQAACTRAQQLGRHNFFRIRMVILTA